MFGLQDVFIIWFYYKQRRPVLKNEVKKDNKAATAAIRPADGTKVDHTQSFSIKDILEYKQTANKRTPSSPPPHPLHLKATQHVVCVCVCVSLFYKHRHLCNGVTTKKKQKNPTSFAYRLVHIAWRHKHKLCCVDPLILDFKVCFVDAACVCMRERGEKRKCESKGFNFI